jgi:hypothetical protein
MDSSGRTASGTALVHERSQPASPDRNAWHATAIYSACSGLVAMVVGAAASLTAATADRVVVWIAVASVTAVGAGLTWNLGLVSSCREAISRWLAALSSS